MVRPSPNVLADIPLFRRLSVEDRLRVADLAEVKVYERGDRIFEEGEPSDYFVVITGGRVKVFKHTPAGHDVILELFGPGSLVGAVAVYESRAYPASAEALESVSCVRIPRASFFALLEQNPSLVRGLLSGLSHRLVELTARLGELSGARVEVRFARLFLKLAEQLGRTDNGVLFIPLHLSRRDLADLTGTTIETTIRVMSRWGKEGLIRTDRDGFAIVDRAKLEELGAGA